MCNVIYRICLLNTEHEFIYYSLQMHFNKRFVSCPESSLYQGPFLVIDHDLYDDIRLPVHYHCYSE